MKLHLSVTVAEIKSEMLQDHELYWDALNEHRQPDRLPCDFLTCIFREANWCPQDCPLKV